MAKNDYKYKSLLTKGIKKMSKSYSESYKAAGVDIAAAAWAHNVKGIADFMKENCEYYCKTIDELRKILFD